MVSRLLLLAALGLGCRSAPPPREFDGAAALEYARAQLAFGPRIPGTDGHRLMGLWLDSLLRTRADTVVVQDWAHVTRAGDTLPMRNVLARFNPAATRRLLFLAHWDTRPRADADTGARAGQPVPGANDGASGVAVLLAMADALRSAPPALGVDLLLVDGEDYGIFDDERHDVLIGSQYYAANQPPGPAPEYAVLLDMVGGRDARFRKEGYSMVAAPGVVELVWSTAARLGYGGIFLNETGGSVVDDHIPLQRVGIRAIDVIPDIPGGYPPWHTVDDTLEQLSAATLQAVGDVMMALIREGRRAG
jgi:glutaminyl-peptide cyclotransferase